ncbi:hypothetical protein LCGC14_0245190 [marine sediment metagenome]|uniref:NAD-dependent epimerase/dehydratase domain-containing protein n=1 Tax=marine sediment metagenome TaxID=412755 RepID=A0A0F9UN33_9ZZZZ
MRYLVTGAAGFIGARFVESCNKEKIELISVDKLANFSRPDHDGLDFGLKLDTDDIMQHLLHDAPRHIDAIIHLGAITDTAASDIHELRRLNTDFSHDLWEYASEYLVPFVYASSAATYGAADTFSDDEDDLRNLMPLNHYGMSKHAFDLDVLKLERRGIVPPSWAGFKFFNVYGYGESHKGRMASMVYQALKQIKETKKLILFRSHNEEYDDGMQSRDFIYVDDVVKVLHWSIANSKRGIYNLGTGASSPFLDLAIKAFEALKVFPKIVWVDTPEDIRDQYQYYTKAEMTKLRRAGYTQSFIDLQRGINAYVRRLGL